MLLNERIIRNRYVSLNLQLYAEIIYALLYD